METKEELKKFDWHDMFRVMPINEEHKEFVLVLGKALATETRFRNEEDAWKYAKTPKWDTIMALFAEMIDIKFEKIKMAKMEKAEMEVKEELKNVE